MQVQQESYSSSSSSELSAEKSKPGPPPARGGGGVGSLGRLAGAGAAGREDPAPVAATVWGDSVATELAAVERVVRRGGGCLACRSATSPALRRRLLDGAGGSAC